MTRRGSGLMTDCVSAQWALAECRRRTLTEFTP
jgi:hypothetical protein